MTYLLDSRFTRASVRTLLISGLGIGLVISLVACGSKSPNGDAAKAQPVIAVELVSPAVRDWQEQITASGNVAAWQEATIGVEVGGVKLDSVLVNVGDQVHKGQLLAQFNEDSLRTDLAQQEAAVALADANLGKANSEYDRAKLLETTGSISQQDITQYQTTAATANANLASAKALRDASLLKIRYAKIIAPDDGVISSRTATVGAVGTVGSELFKLIRNSRLEWRAEVDAENLGRIQSGKAVTLLRPDGKQVTGSVRQLAPTIDSSTRYGLVYVDLPAHSGLTAGMYVKGLFGIGVKTALVVPESTIMFRDGNNYVMKVDTENRAHQIKITTGRRQDQQIEISNNLSTDDKLILSGASFVNDGDLVSVSANNTNKDGAQ
jgi:RND family efflux transporter MFP subunit